jgi:hypothetical protein
LGDGSDEGFLEQPRPKVDIFAIENSEAEALDYISKHA